jgi:hypothetical protein
MKAIVTGCATSLVAFPSDRTAAVWTRPDVLRVQVTIVFVLANVAFVSYTITVLASYLYGRT